VEISGVHNASLAHVMDVAAAEAIARNIFSIDLEERRQKLEQIPWVEQATVMRLLPNRLAVIIRERTPVAFAQIGPRVSLIDANGVVMGMPADRKTKYSFPVIRGIAETEPLSSRAAAMKIYNRLVGELSTPDADGKEANYVRQLSEVDLSDPEDVKVTANDPGGTIVVHLGPADFLPHYKLYVAHIAEWRQQFPNLESVDLRYEGQVVVNPDKLPAAQPKKGSPLMNTDNTDQKKQAAKATVKPVSAKVAAKPVAKPVSHKTASASKKTIHHGGTETRRKQGKSNQR
jgi:cell division protein FtsQ